MSNKTYDDVSIFLDAGLPCLLVGSHEEARVRTELLRISNHLDSSDMSGPKTIVQAWSCTRGLVPLGSDASMVMPEPVRIDGTQTTLNPERLNETTILTAIQDAAVEELRRGDLDEPTSRIWILHDYMFFLTEFPKKFSLGRLLRDIAETITHAGAAHTIIIIDSVTEIPDRLSKVITRINWPLPDKRQIQKLVRSMFADLDADARANGAEAIAEWDATVEDITKAALGLTETEIGNTLAQSRAQYGLPDPKSVMKAKSDIIKATGFLEYYEPEGGMETVGGLNALKTWTMSRQKGFSDEAAAFGLDPPKGMVLVGVSGCGKSHIAKAIAAAYGMVCIKFDVGKCMGKYVGQSENQMAEALQLVEVVSPAVFLMDEIEKMFAGIGGGDGTGVSTRMFGQFLNWMQENRKHVFVVATANAIDQLPPELTRKGRFDEVFFVDLPSDEERREIFSIHIKRKKRELVNFDMDTLVRVSKKLSGAEIEAAVKAGLYAAFDAGTELTTELIVQSIKETKGVAELSAEKVEALQLWAASHARAATLPTYDDDDDIVTAKPVIDRSSNRGRRRRYVPRRKE